jgi:GTPase Era involved in 16S rRNA processing
MTDSAATRAGFVALIGATNAGKSTHAHDERAV